MMLPFFSYPFEMHDLIHGRTGLFYARFLIESTIAAAIVFAAIVVLLTVESSIIDAFGVYCYIHFTWLRPTQFHEEVMKEINTTPRVEGLLPGNWNESMLLALALTGHVLRTAFECFVGVAMSRMRLLAYMYNRGELSQADLQRHLEIDGATVTRQVKQMEAEGLLQRRADPKDNRFTLVELTPAGQAMVESLIKRGQEFQRLAVRSIDGEQLSAAVAVLAQMRCNLQALAGGDYCTPEQEGDAKQGTGE
jgi:DNA-binding MarR family transcriptional regulator